MQSQLATVEEYIAELPEDRQKPIAELHKIIRKKFTESICRRNRLWYDRICRST